MLTTKLFSFLCIKSRNSYWAKWHNFLIYIKEESYIKSHTKAGLIRLKFKQANLTYNANLVYKWTITRNLILFYYLHSKSLHSTSLSISVFLIRTRHFLTYKFKYLMYVEPTFQLNSKHQKLYHSDLYISQHGLSGLDNDLEEAWSTKIMVHGSWLSLLLFPWSHQKNKHIREKFRVSKFKSQFSMTTLLMLLLK